MKSTDLLREKQYLPIKYKLRFMIFRYFIIVCRIMPPPTVHKSENINFNVML